jgi:lipoprotein-anchoring transpeptidase ErfK/SrfK
VSRASKSLILFLLAAGPAVAADSAFRRVLAWQIALEQTGLSPGLIDGIEGPKTRLATAEFQRVRGLPQTGKLDARTAALLKPDADNAVTTYTITAADRNKVGPVPRGWVARSKLDRLKYESLAAFVAEKHHCSTRCLARLNPGVSLSRLSPGDTVRVPRVAEPETVPGARLIVNLAEKTIRVLDAKRRLVGLFHCSIAADRSQAPKGETAVKVIVHDPEYTFNPKKWPEVRGVNRVLQIPPGPRNPVGLCWIGLDLRGYGIHGTPAADLIGKTGSHGCIRLTNWDALRLAEMIRVGTPVEFTADADQKW